MPENTNRPQHSHAAEYEEKGKSIDQEEWSVRISYSGPLPPPETLKKYEEMQPGVTDRLLTVIEEQEENRRKMEQTTIERKFTIELAGMILGFIILSIFMVGGIILLMLEKDTAGFFSLFGPALVLLMIRLFSKRPSQTQSTYEQGQHHSSQTQDQQDGQAKE